MNREHAEAVAVIEAQVGEYTRINHAHGSLNDREMIYQFAGRLGKVSLALHYIKEKLGFAESDNVTLRPNVPRWDRIGVEHRVQALKMAVEDFFDNVPF